HDSICLAPDVHVSHAHRAIFLHRRGGQDSHRWWCRDVNDPLVVAPIPAAPDLLADTVELRAVTYGANARLGAGGAEVVLAEDQTQPDGPLAGWKLVHAGQVAVLRKGKEWSLLRPMPKTGGERR